MSNILKLALTAIIGALLFTAPSIARSSDYIGNFERVPAVQDRPPQVATWDVTPTVIVCDSAPISETQIKSGVRFWKNLGYRFFPTQYKYDPMGKCENSNPTGYIIIHLVTEGVKLEDVALAQTHFFVDNETNTIDWAIIYFRSDVRSTVLEHELGHALGFLHYNKINHLMNQKWTQGGWDKEGLENTHR